MGCGIEDREVHGSDNVKEVSRLGEPPMGHITLPVSKGGFPWKGEMGWDSVACMSQRCQWLLLAEFVRRKTWRC